MTSTPRTIQPEASISFVAMEMNRLKFTESDIFDALLGVEQQRSIGAPRTSRDSRSNGTVNYSVNLYVAYDRSSCYRAMNDDGPEREVCRTSGKYEGL
jgi:hypothetical protein